MRRWLARRAEKDAELEGKSKKELKAIAKQESEDLKAFEAAEAARPTTSRVSQLGC